jgi:uncharacterized surface protein with fasciclin (FAS1) repeats
MSTDLAAGSQDVKTVQGESATVVVADSGVTYAGANVTATDVEACNGVIHVIDTVVVPPSAKQ